jgi:hypothetical protein
MIFVAFLLFVCAVIVLLDVVVYPSVDFIRIRRKTSKYNQVFIMKHSDTREVMLHLGENKVLLPDGRIVDAPFYWMERKEVIE